VCAYAMCLIARWRTCSASCRSAMKSGSLAAFVMQQVACAAFCGLLLTGRKQECAGAGELGAAHRGVWSGRRQERATAVERDPGRRDEPRAGRCRRQARACPPRLCGDRVHPGPAQTGAVPSPAAAAVDHFCRGCALMVHHAARACLWAKVQSCWMHPRPFMRT
jgi:hypothetical protein